MRTKIHIIRHGETDSNVKHRFMGCTDIPLNERGLAQAKCLREPMAKMHIDQIYSSPYLRTMMTAQQVLGDRDMQILKEPGLCEINCGEWEELNREEIEERWPGMINLWQFEPDNLRMPGGETFEQVQNRSVEAFLEIVKKEAGKSIVIVSHMLPIQLIVAKLLGIPIRDVWNMNRLENTSVTSMDIWENGDFEFTKWGDDSHLLPELKNKHVRIAGFVTGEYNAAHDLESVEGKHHYEGLKL